MPGGGCGGVGATATAASIGRGGGPASTGGVTAVVRAGAEPNRNRPRPTRKTAADSPVVIQSSRPTRRVWRDDTASAPAPSDSAAPPSDSAAPPNDSAVPSRRTIFTSPTSDPPGRGN